LAAITGVARPGMDRRHVILAQPLNLKRDG
jgi:hypothetical protein